MRFVIFNAGNGLLSIRDNATNHIVCAFFRQKSRCEATERMAAVCLRALNEAVKPAQKDKQHG